LGGCTPAAWPPRSGIHIASQYDAPAAKLAACPRRPIVLYYAAKLVLCALCIVVVSEVTKFNASLGTVYEHECDDQTLT
jgi:hypothetical protein